MTRSFAFLLLLLAPLRAADSNPSARTPVLVELFTSEGCSSCPPADALLARLDETQPVAGVTVIALEEHVDYWDHLGWRDPFSSAGFTLRQQRYAALLHLESPYTPEMVIDGRSEFVGNDPQRALHELANAAQNAKTPIYLTVSGHATLSVHIDAAPAPATIWLAIAETGLTSDVARGENAGHNLKHSAVVRKLTPIGKLKPAAPFSAEQSIKPAKQWKPEHLRAVVFVTDSTAQVRGAAEVALAR